MRGKTSFDDGLINGEVLLPTTANDMQDVAASTDDDATYDLLDLEPPAAATLTNVRHGFAGLQPGAIVSGDGAAVQVHVAPIRVMRSSSSNATPRAIVSGTIDTSTTKTLGTAPGAGKYGYDLLYAELTYVDPANPIKGTTITLKWAAPTYVTFASAAVFGALPADTNTTWNVPIAYVHHYAAQASVAAADIIEFPPVVDTGVVYDVQRRIKKLGAHDVCRAYASDHNDPTKLISGGTSAWLSRAAAETLGHTSATSPLVATRRNVEEVVREICIPPCDSATGGTASTATLGGGIDEFIIDDTRDWRGANFVSDWFVHQTTAIDFAEDSVGATKVMPCTGHGGTQTAWHHVCGQSWAVHTPHATFGSKLWAAVVGADAPGGASLNGIVDAATVAGNGWGLYVHATTGALYWWANRQVGAPLAGPAVWIVLRAFFSNHYA